MRIALIGNMNNANFALLRYLKDLGYDAKLFLYENDATNDNNHFNWTNDTWKIKTWRKFIVKTKIRNSHAQILSGNTFFYYLLVLFHKTIKLFGFSGGFVDPGVKNIGNYLNSLFKEFDLIIGSGNTPALFSFSKEKKLNIFYPYSTGVEYVNVVLEYENFLPFRFFQKCLINKAREIQIKGLKYNTELVYNAEMGITNKTLIGLGCRVKNNFIPAVYIEKSNKFSEFFIIKKLIEKSNFTVLMHSRHKWDDSEIHQKNWELNENKNNHWLIYAFSSLLKKYPKSNSKLFLLEYGENIDKSKKLISDLNLEKHVYWIKKMPRKKLIEIVKSVDLVAGEFYKAEQMIWGGTGWEAFSCGKPFMNSFRFINKSFDEIFGIPPPRILKSNSINDVTNSLIEAFENSDQLNKDGNYNKLWYEQFIGKNQVKQWISDYESTIHRIQ